MSDLAGTVAAPAQPLAHITLGHLDSAIFLLSVAVAALLRYGRHRAGQELSNEQLFYDMLSFWTLVELLLLFSADLDLGIGLPVPDFSELIRSNGVLLPIALAYCAFLVAQSTLWPTIISLRSAEKPKPTGAGAPQETTKRP